MRFTPALLLIAVAVATPAAGQEPNKRELLEAFEKQLKATAAAAGPGIATVVVSRSEHYPKAPGPATPGKLGGFDPKEFLKNDPTGERAKLADSLVLSDPRRIPEHGYAGGVVIDPAGLVLTPYHVVEGATRVYVFLPGGGGSYADIHAADARSDLAVLSLIKPPPGLRAIKLADVRTTERSDLKANMMTGKLVVLMANPYSSSFALDKPSAAFGSITNVRYRPAAGGEQTSGAAKNYYRYGTLLEHDVRLNAGVTGGVLLDLDGKLVGLTTAAAAVPGGELGPGYAIPADENFRRALGVLRKGEEVEYGFLGVTLPNSNLLGPVVVSSTTPQGPAALAGIVSGDQIVRVNDLPVHGYDDLLLHVGSALAGSTVPVTIGRGQRTRDIEVTLGKFRHDLPFIASVRPEPVFGLRVDYGSVLGQLPGNDLRVQAGGVGPGVSVREVIPDSPAAARFKTLGDVPTRWLVTQVNGTTVATPAEFYKAAKGQQSVKLTLIDPAELNPRTRELTLP